MHHLLQIGLVEKEVLEILKEKGIGDENTNLDTNLNDDLGLDSLDIAELTMNLEVKFNISISMETAYKWDTVRDVVNYINNTIRP